MAGVFQRINSRLPVQSAREHTDWSLSHMVAGFSLTGTKRTRPFETTFWNLPKYKMYLTHRGRSRPLKLSGDNGEDEG